MTTGERIKALRLSKHLSQEELGNIIGVKKAAINKYETGIVVNLKRSTISKLADALETSPMYLMGWEDSNGNQDLGLTALDVAGWIGENPSGVEAVMQEMGWPDATKPEVVAKIASEVQKRKLTPVSGSELNDAEYSLIKLFRLVPSENQEMVVQMIEAALKSQGLL